MKHNIEDYLELVKIGFVLNIGEWSEIEEGYFCVVSVDGRKRSAIVRIEGQRATYALLDGSFSSWVDLPESSATQKE